MKPEIDYTLYLVTDRELMSSATIEENVEQAIRGGCTLVQLREKKASSRCFYETALRVRQITRRMGVPLIINDRADIAAAVDADGVHVGQEDMPPEAVRKIIGPDRILGVSAGTLDEALTAERDGADYLGIGAMYATGTKTDAALTGMDELRDIRRRIKLPIVAIGGINKETVLSFAGTGIDGIAVVSAIVSRPDVETAARELKALFIKRRNPE
ncbi:MAG: thiamine phosphate synthase [Spirochaetaceae bacterium]|jgi:thiamine-phosphate pyrophosphorylase|nr:thiamine phosphate synthase [Spirochaetaceae bacterium]